MKINTIHQYFGIDLTIITTGHKVHVLPHCWICDFDIIL